DHSAQWLGHGRPDVDGQRSASPRAAFRRRRRPWWIRWRRRRTRSRRKARSLVSEAGPQISTRGCHRAPLFIFAGMVDLQQTRRARGQGKSIKPFVATLHTVGMFLLQRLWSRRGGLKSIMSQIDERLRLKRFHKKRHRPPVDAVALQFFIDIGRYENDMKILPHAQRADGKFMTVDMGKFIVA